MGEAAVSAGLCTIVREPEFGDEALYDELGRLLDEESAFLGGISDWTLAKHGCETVERRVIADADALEWDDMTVVWPPRLAMLRTDPA